MILTRIVFVIAVVVSLCASDCRAAEKDAAGKDLAAALLCKGEPLTTFRDIARTGNKGFPMGIAAHTWGQGLDEQGVIILKAGITVAGARADAVRMSFSSPAEDFNAFVYAEFEGDADRVIRELRLQKSAPKGKNNVAIGEYVNPPAVDPKRFERGEVKELCPKTIALTPLSKRKFLLGCGWCPG